MMAPDEESSDIISEYISFDENEEEDIEEHFNRRFKFLKAVGVFIGRKDEDGRYTFDTKRLLLAYITW